MTPNLGDLPIDLTRLLESRLLIQANSGGGKSHALRRILEQTATGVQQIVIDPEGEFASLRERFEFIIAAPSGADAVATPATAAALARAIWESGVSAIVDVYELKAHERITFVRRFVDALVNAPKKVWHPTLVAIDEIHVFAPQTGQAESLGAVTDLATRGRKRGLSLLGATQRLAKLHKDVAAELLNKLIGRTGLDVDVARAADELGLSRADARMQLRDLEPGQFFAYGPALSRAVVRTQIGKVVTTHPQAGQRMMTAPPPASHGLLQKLAKLEGLQRAAVEEVRSVASLTEEVKKLRLELASAQKAPAGFTEADVRRRIDEAVKEARAPAAPSSPTVSKALLAGVEKIAVGLQAVQATLAGADAAPAPRARAAQRSAAPAPAPRASGSVEGLRAGAVRILAELAARAPAGYSRAQVGALTQFSPKGGTFNTYLGDLRRGAFIEERTGLVYATEHGVAQLGDQMPAKATTHVEAMQLWRRALRSGAFAMLETIVAAGPAGITRAEIAAAVGMQASGGTFNTYLGDLRRNGLITEQAKRCVANDILFPEGRA